MRDHPRVLEILGLSDADESLYETVVTTGAFTLAEVTGLSAEGTRAGQVAAGLARLEELGLVSRLAGPPPRWVAVAPDTALGTLIAARRRSLNDGRRWLAELTARYRPTPTSIGPLDLVEVIHGREAGRRAVEEVQRTARHEVRWCDVPPYVRPPDGNPVESEQLNRGVRYRILYDRQAVALPGRLPDLATSIAAGEHARVTDVPMKLVLSDRSLGVVPLRTDPVDLECSLLVRSPVLLDALHALFEMYWDRAVPLLVSDGQARLPDHEAPSEIERDLLSLLVAGLTEQAIAEHLGWHVRTVRRHLSRLHTRLDAATRFQAGYQAVLRGWLSAAELGTADE